MFCFILGLTFANGEEWKQCRTFVLNMFRNFGVGKKGFEEVVRNEGDKLVKEICRQGHVLDVSYIFSMSSCNIISKLVFNQQLEYTDPNLQEQVATVLKHFQLAGPGSLNSMTPIFAHFRIGPGQRIVNNYKVMKRLWCKQIQDHIKKGENSEHEDILDVYLAELQKHLTAGTKTQFKMHNLLWLLRDLYLAGTETTSTTLKWAVLYLAAHPEKQRKCHEELDKEFSQDCVLSYADRTKLPYVNAFIMETLRLGDILPLGVAHEAAEDVILEQYLIPKGTIVTSNIRAVSMDANIFPDPENFNPERFLTADGNYKAIEEMMPFGVGKIILYDKLFQKYKTKSDIQLIMAHELYFDDSGNTFYCST